MRIGSAGLGRMGANMALRRAIGGVRIVAFDANAARAGSAGIETVDGHAARRRPGNSAGAKVGD